MSSAPVSASWGHLGSEGLRPLTDILRPVSCLVGPGCRGDGRLFLLAVQCLGLNAEYGLGSKAALSLQGSGRCRDNQVNDQVAARVVVSPA